MASGGNGELEQLRLQLKSLENFQLPANLQSQTSNDENSDPAADAEVSTLVKRYQHVRKEYLRRRILQTFFSHVANFQPEENSDSSCFDIPAVPSAEEQQEALERRDQVISEVREVTNIASQKL